MTYTVYVSLAAPLGLPYTKNSSSKDPVADPEGLGKPKAL